MIIELANCERTILQEISNKQFKQRSIAKTYALAMRSSEPVDWSKVNAAIIERWSVSGLDRIKKMAWSGSCFEATE